LDSVDSVTKRKNNHPKANFFPFLNPAIHGGQSIHFPTTAGSPLWYQDGYQTQS
jgi:hypothetical protein